jgi:hypothetical protein
LLKLNVRRKETKMPTIKTDTHKTDPHQMDFAPSGSKTEEIVIRTVQHDADEDRTLFPEAIAHILTPRRRRTTVSSASFAAIKCALEEK